MLFSRFGKHKKQAIFAGLAFLLLLSGIVAYEKWFAPTRIALVNYPEYVLAPLLDQDLPSSIEAVPVEWNEKSGKELKNYDMILFFGMGLNFTEKQQELLRNLKKPLFVTSSTRRETALNSLPDDAASGLRSYLNHLNRKNFLRMMNFIRVKIDGKTFGSNPVEPAVESVHSGFFHSSEETVFKTAAEYWNWYKKAGRYRENVPVVCVLTGNGGRETDVLINALESRKLNVAGVSGMGRYLPLLKELKPDLVISMPHGRLSFDDPEGTIAFFKERNIPFLCPIKVNQPYEEFLRDQRGMTGGMLSQSVVMPELDGAAMPFVLSALFRNKRGLQEYRMIPERVETFCERVRKTLELKRKPNSEKKLAIVYYKGPGKNALVASGLEVGPSLLNTLKHLHSAGYKTGPLPATPEDLIARIQKEAPVFGSYAVGAREEFLKHSKTVNIPREEFLRWLGKAVPKDLAEEVVRTHGEVPSMIRLGALRFGNILLIPQGAPGSGSDENTLVHGVKQIPPYPYLATYFYCRFEFQADALMHFGTHGSLEFTPWKQVALSNYDWPDALIGEMPHYYLYIINNIGEALIAKRRSYATILSHLTAPFMNADSQGPLAQLKEKMDYYEKTDSAMLKNEYAKSIIQITKKLHIDKDLKLSDNFAKGILSEEDFHKIHEHIHEIEDSKVHRGMYVIGRPYNSSEARETATLMTVDVVASALFDQDVEEGKVTPEKKDDLLFFQRVYLPKAREKIQSAFLRPKITVPEKKMEATDAQMDVMLQSGKLPDGRDLPPAMRDAMRQMRKHPAEKKEQKPVLPPEYIAVRAQKELLLSTQAELDAMLNAFAGGYTLPSSGGDPVGNPDAVPTGHNLYGIDPDRTPTRESYNAGKKLGEALIAEKRKQTGKYPKKVAFSLWGGEFIRTQGTNIGEIFFLLGVEPVWDSRGRVVDVRLIPDEKLKRPRIDVVIQTSGQFRGAATSRMRLIDKAVRLATEAPAGEFGNYVREGSLTVAKTLVAGGMSAEDAKNYANARIFGGVNGNFGPGITGMIQSGDRWEDPAVIGELYIRNMSALYTDSHWGESVNGVFRAALADTDTVVQSRSSNSWGPLSLDHVYEFTGGISLAAKQVTGKNPDAYFNDLRTPGRVRIQEAGEAAMVEARSTLLNPKYLKEMLKEGPSAAGTFAEAFRNTLGWEVTRPGMIDDHLWEDYKQVFVDDSLRLGMKEFFEKKNPYALQEMTGVMLESIRKGYWKASPETTRQLAERHTELIRKFGAGCGGYTCNNSKLRELIGSQLQQNSAKNEYKQAIDKVRNRPTEPAKEVSGQTLKEKKITLQKEPGKENPKKALGWIGILVLIGITAMLIGSRRSSKK